MDYFSDITRAALATAKPTEAQAQAGNYRKGRVEIHGLKIAIETPRGQYREGVGRDGKPWSNLMKATYGHFEKYKGNDGDGVDCFIGEYPETEQVWIINQKDPASGKFDEHKVMLGFTDMQAAQHAYQKSYSAGWSGMMDMIGCSIAQLDWWLQYGDKTKPVSIQNLPYQHGDNMTNNDLTLDSVTVADIMADADAVLGLDALVLPYAKIDLKMRQMMGIFKMAADAVKPVAYQVTEPFRQKGTTQVAAVFEMDDGQTVSVFFHNPDVTPNKITPQDDLVSWKWLLNRKDVTIVVAPEKGQDLNVREVARRMMKLVDKNSERFKKANADKASRMETLASAEREFEEKAGILEALNTEIAELEADREERKSAKAIAAANAAVAAQAWRSDSFDPIANFKEIMGDRDALIAWQDRLDSFFNIRIVDIRNALSDMGWNKPAEEKKNWPMEKSGALLELNVLTEGAGANVVGAGYVVKKGGNSIMQYSDDLSKTPKEVAKMIDAAIPKESDADIPFFSKRGGKMVISSPDGKTDMPSDWTGIAYGDGEVKFWLIGQDAGERSFTALKSKTIEEAREEAKEIQAAIADDRSFLQSAIDGKVDFYDKTTTNRIAEIDKRSPAHGDTATLVLAAKKAAKDFLIAEFKKKVA